MSPRIKASKGSVAIESFQGRLRLRLPRQIYAGKQKYLTLGLADTEENRRAAEAKARQIELDILSGRFDPSLESYRPKLHLSLVHPKEVSQRVMALDELWDRYTEYRKPFLSPTHYRYNYQSTYRNAILQLPTKNLNDAVAIRDYLVTVKTPTTAKQLLIQINACCQWAVESGLIVCNPFQGMAKKVKLEKEKIDNIDPFTTAERDAIIQAFEEHPTYSHYAPFVKFLFLTGCRTSEAIGLQWKHIAPNLSHITFCEALTKRIRKDTKTHQSRNFPCNSQLKALLYSIKPEHSKPDDLVFTNINGKAIKAETFSHNAWKGEESKNKTGIVSRLVQEGKVERYRPQYNTRHTFVTMALEAGVSPVQVAKWVGNSPEIIMKHYAGTTLNIQVPEF